MKEKIKQSTLIKLQTEFKLKKNDMIRSHMNEYMIIPNLGCILRHCVDHTVLSSKLM